MAPAPDDPEDDRETAASRRKNPRDSLLIMAQMRSLGPEQAVRLRNLSPEGAMIEGDLNLRKGEPVTIQIRNSGWVAGRVAWALPGRCGVTFDTPIDPKAARSRT